MKVDARHENRFYWITISLASLVGRRSSEIKAGKYKVSFNQSITRGSRARGAFRALSILHADRNSDVEHLALANQVIQPSHHFFDRRHLAPDVHPEQVDVIGLQPSEARFYSLHHILAVIAAGVRIGARSCSRVFRGQHHALAMVLHKLAQKRFARPLSVRVGGVDEIHPPSSCSRSCGSGVFVCSVFIVSWGVEDRSSPNETMLRAYFAAPVKAVSLRRSGRSTGQTAFT